MQLTRISTHIMLYQTALYSVFPRACTALSLRERERRSMIGVTKGPTVLRINRLIYLYCEIHESANYKRLKMKNQSD